MEHVDDVMSELYEAMPPYYKDNAGAFCDIYML